METFALVAFLLVNGEAESFVLDRDLSRRDCAIVAEFVTAESILADPGIRIAWQTATGEPRLELDCIAERSA